MLILALRYVINAVCVCLIGIFFLVSLDDLTIFFVLFCVVNSITVSRERNCIVLWMSWQMRQARHLASAIADKSVMRVFEVGPAPDKSLGLP